jgi:hypothetical protein
MMATLRHDTRCAPRAAGDKGSAAVEPERRDASRGFGGGGGLWIDLHHVPSHGREAAVGGGHCCLPVAG